MKLFINSNRKSNFELLRIISMFLIVFTHFYSYGNLGFTSDLTFNHLFTVFFEMGAKLGVDVFILISGFFLVNSQKVNFQKMFKLIGTTFFYSVFTYIIGLILGNKFELSSLKNVFFPITYYFWWFISAYFVLYLIHPVLNIVICSIDRKTYNRILLVMFFIWSVISTFLSSFYQANELVFFVFLYFISGYIKKYSDTFKLKNKTYILSSIICAGLTFLSYIVISLAGKKIKILSGNAIHFYNMRSVFIVILAVSLFMLFKNIDIKPNKYINTFASATIGVYLIHDSSYIREYIWSLFSKLGFSVTSPLYIIEALGLVIGVYLICSIIELIRMNTIEPVYMKYVVKAEKLLKEKYSKSKIKDYI